jgi:hypothetical protein
MRATLILGLGACLLGACSGNTMADDTTYDCAMETRADTFVVGLEKLGNAGLLDFKLMDATPAPPARDDNTWVIEIDMAGGAPVSGAAMVAVPFMPDHQHGTPIAVHITPEATPGQYKLTPVNLWMPGLWETTIQATAGTTSDTVVYRFCIPS